MKNELVVLAVKYLFIAIKKFYDTDYKGFESYTNGIKGMERACAFRIGFYFRKMIEEKELANFYDYTVDMEYNRHGNKKKEREFFVCELEGNALEKYETLRKKPEYLTPKEAKELESLLRKKIYSDLIVHKRGNDSNNLLVVEFKVNDDKKTDANKLKSLTKYQDKYVGNYQLGIFINIQEACKCLAGEQNVEKMKCVLDRWDFFQEGNEILNGGKQKLVDKIIYAPNTANKEVKDGDN
jgi:hypothetical protein